MSLSILQLTGFIWLGSFGAGLLGALTGLGGGVVIVPLLTLVFKVDIRYAIGASLVSVIATSTGAGAAYLRRGYANLKVGMFLAIATTLGALLGAGVANFLSASTVSVIFGFVLMASAYFTVHNRRERPGWERPDVLAATLRLDGSYPGAEGLIHYRVRGVMAGFGIMWVAGMLSGLLGIGSGAVKVLALDHAMRMPFKASAATSNFMIGLTAAASAGVYLSRGYVDPGLVMPVVLGVLPGAMLGALLLERVRVSYLRAFFAVVLLVLASEMLYKGMMGRM